MAHGGTLVRGHIERMSLGNPARRKRLSSERWERRQRRRSDLRVTNGYSGIIRVSVVTCFSAGHLTSAPYLTVTDGVSQSKIFDLQDKDAVVELDEVTSFLLS